MIPALVSLTVSLSSDLLRHNGLFQWREVVEKGHKVFRVGFRFIKVQRSGSIDIQMHKVIPSRNFSRNITKWPRSDCTYIARIMSSLSQIYAQQDDARGIGGVAPIRAFQYEPGPAAVLRAQTMLMFNKHSKNTILYQACLPGIDLRS